MRITANPQSLAVAYQKRVHKRVSTSASNTAIRKTLAALFYMVKAARQAGHQTTNTNGIVLYQDTQVVCRHLAYLMCMVMQSDQAKEWQAIFSNPQRILEKMQQYGNWDELLLRYSNQCVYHDITFFGESLYRLCSRMKPGDKKVFIFNNTEHAMHVEVQVKPATQQKPERIIIKFWDPNYSNEKRKALLSSRTYPSLEAIKYIRLTDLAHQTVIHSAQQSFCFLLDICSDQSETRSLFSQVDLTLLGEINPASINKLFMSFSSFNSSIEEMIWANPVFCLKLIDHITTTTYTDYFLQKLCQLSGYEFLLRIITRAKHIFNKILHMASTEQQYDYLLQALLTKHHNQPTLLAMLCNTKKGCEQLKILLQMSWNPSQLKQIITFIIRTPGVLTQLLSIKDNPVIDDFIDQALFLSKRDTSLLKEAVKPMLFQLDQSGLKALTRFAQVNAHALVRCFHNNSDEECGNEIITFLTTKSTYRHSGLGTILAYDIKLWHQTYQLANTPSDKIKLIEALCAYALDQSNTDTTLVLIRMMQQDTNQLRSLLTEAVNLKCLPTILNALLIPDLQGNCSWIYLLKQDATILNQLFLLSTKENLPSIIQALVHTTDDPDLLETLAHYAPNQFKRLMLLSNPTDKATIGKRLAIDPYFQQLNLPTTIRETLAQSMQQWTQSNDLLASEKLAKLFHIIVSVHAKNKNPIKARQSFSEALYQSLGLFKQNIRAGSLWQTASSQAIKKLARSLNTPDKPSRDRGTHNGDMSITVTRERATPISCSTIHANR